MNKIAIIADIHGNREALKTALQDIKQRNCDQIICLGDIIEKGSFSSECISLIKENCDIVLQGNRDDYFVKEHDWNILTEKEKQKILYYRKQLTPEDMTYLSSLPFCHEFYLSGRLIRLFHAGPDTIYNYSNTSVVASLEKKYKMFEPNTLTLSDNIADVVIYGHIHTQLLSNIYNRTLVCCGSVGNNLNYIRNDQKDGNILNTTSVQYVILEGILDSKEYDSFHIEFVQVPYNIEKELEDSKNNYEFDSLYYELKHGTYRDKKKIADIFAQDGVYLTDTDHH